MTQRTRTASRFETELLDLWIQRHLMAPVGFITPTRVAAIPSHGVVTDE